MPPLEITQSNYPLQIVAAKSLTQAIFATGPLTQTLERLANALPSSEIGAFRLP